MPNYTQGLLSLFLVITCCGGMAQETVKLGIRQNMIKPTVGNNGVFWSHGVAHHIYTQAGYKSKIISRPAKRLPQALDRGEVDFIFSTKAALGEFQGKFIRSKLPTTMLAFHIYYDHRKDWQPTWPPDKIFKQKIGKSAHSAVTLRKASQLNISLTSAWPQALTLQ